MPQGMPGRHVPAELGESVGIGGVTMAGLPLSAGGQLEDGRHKSTALSERCARAGAAITAAKLTIAENSGACRAQRTVIAGKASH
jgi:hypothetical protein